MQNKVYLESSFHTVDMDNVDLLPDVLLKPDNFELAKEFVNKWNGLKVRVVFHMVEMFRLRSTLLFIWRGKHNYVSYFVKCFYELK